jgi:hypothetical protein
MPFGKYAGNRVCDVPSGYLRWCLRTVGDLEPWLRAKMEAVLRDRSGAGPNPPTATVTMLQAPAAAIDGWYRKLVLKYHPDRGGSHAEMLVVNEAHETLREILETCT